MISTPSFFHASTQKLFSQLVCDERIAQTFVNFRLISTISLDHLVVRTCSLNLLTSIGFVNLLGVHIDFANLLGVHIDFVNLLDGHIDFVNLLDVHIDFVNLLDAHIDFVNLLDYTSIL